MKATETSAVLQQYKSDAILKGPLRQDEEVEATGTITCTTNRDSLASADIIFIPASRRSGEIDRLKSISEMCREDALIAVNTRYNYFDSLIADAAHPKNVIGTRTYQCRPRVCVCVRICLRS